MSEPYRHVWSLASVRIGSGRAWERHVADGFVVREAETEQDDEAVAGLMTAYLEWGHQRLSEEYGVNDPPGDPALVRQGLGQFRSPHGLLLIAECDGEAAGVGALRVLSAGVAEVKRMYVTPRWRGRHLGTALLDRLLSESEKRRVQTVRLDTARFMVDAHRLYMSRGFVERPAYPGTEIPPHLQQYWMFFERHDTNPASGANA